MSAGGTTVGPSVNIGPRPVPQEPMECLISFTHRRISMRADGNCQYMILNLGISLNLGFIDFEHLMFPTTMSVDYVWVYQNPDNINIRCELDGFPTQVYIKKCMLFLSIFTGVADHLYILFLFLFRFTGAGLHKSEPDHMEEQLPTTVPHELVPGPMLMGWGSVRFCLWQLGLVVSFGSSSCLSFLLHLHIYIYNIVSGCVPSSQCFIYYPHLLFCPVSNCLPHAHVHLELPFSSLLFHLLQTNLFTWLLPSCLFFAEP